MSDYNTHQPVLLDQVLSFVPQGRKINILDLTLGRAGHSDQILNLAMKGSLFVGVDRDIDALEYSSNLLKANHPDKRLKFFQDRFSNASLIKDAVRVKGFDFILMDIGVSSPQFDDPSRGFSYQHDGPLDMRMDQEQTLTAHEIVNSYSEDELVRVFRDLGECSYPRQVARNIVERREEHPIETTFQLVDIIKEALPEKELRKKGHPAKQYFLGLRYEVNGEIDELKKGLDASMKILNPKGRLVVISFNSEEDRIVKDRFREVSRKAVVDRRLPPKADEEPSYIELTRKPILPTEEEVKKNNRSKPAIMRCLEKK